MITKLTLNEPAIIENNIWNVFFFVLQCIPKNISQEQECRDTIIDQQRILEGFGGLPALRMRSATGVQGLDLPNVVERPIDVSFCSFNELKIQKYLQNEFLQPRSLSISLNSCAFL